MLVKPIDIATRTKTKWKLHWGLEWKLQHDLVHIGTWLHRYLNGGAIKTKTNRGLEKVRLLQEQKQNEG